VDGFHVAECGQHHLDFGRLEHTTVFVVVAVLHFDVRLGKEAEDLGQKVAFFRCDLLVPVADVFAQRDFLGHPVDLLLAFPELVRPGVLERLVRFACFKQ